jgi:sugar lactone lactonase YvrE
VRGLPPGTITIIEGGRQASNTLGSQHLVANGLAFGEDGTLFVADTARSAQGCPDAGRCSPSATTFDQGSARTSRCRRQNHYFLSLL